MIPKSLFGRTALLIVGLITLAQLGSALLFRELVLKPRLEQIGDGLARNITAIRAGLVMLPAANRQEFVDAFNRRAQDEMRTRGDERPLVPPMMLTPLERSMMRAVADRVASEGTQIIWRREAGRSLSLLLSVGGASYWLVLPSTLPTREFSGAWVAASLAAAGLALIGALLVQRRLSRPLTRVVEAAGALARGEQPAPLPEDGPTETATLSRSFNQLGSSLARTDRERALMLAGVSHDLRTPMAKLRLGIEIVSDRAEPELVASMTRSIEEMDQIVGQFLDFARAHEGEPVQSGSLDDLARDIAAACADHGQLLTLELGAPPPLPVQAAALRRAVANLVENAFRHGRPPVVLRTGGDAGTAWIEVGDAGDSLPAGDLEALKQPFRRAAGARNGAPGAGLGLAIVDRVAQAHGGRLELARGPGDKGLIARLVLPCPYTLGSAARSRAG